MILRQPLKYSAIFLSVGCFLALLTACGQNTGPLVGAIPRTQTVSLPTKEPTVQPSPLSTRVMPLEVLTPPPTPTITPIPDESLGLVIEVIDGDTIAVVMDGDPVQRAYPVRYLGVDAPARSNPWGTVAYETNRKMTNLKVVRLVRDETDFDAEGFLLRHVYVDNQLMSIILAEQGLARAAIAAPNRQFEDDILAAEERARAGQLGLWGEATPTPTITPARRSGNESENPPAAPVAPPTPTAESVTPTLSPTTTASSATAEATQTTTGTSEPTPEPTETDTPARETEEP